MTARRRCLFLVYFIQKITFNTYDIIFLCLFNCFLLGSGCYVELFERWMTWFCPTHHSLKQNMLKHQATLLSSASTLYISFKTMGPLTALLSTYSVDKVIAYITRRQITVKHSSYVATCITFHFVLKIMSVICVCQYCVINKLFSHFDILPLQCQVQDMLNNPSACSKL